MPDKHHNITGQVNLIKASLGNGNNCDSLTHGRAPLALYEESDNDVCQPNNLSFLLLTVSNLKGGKNYFVLLKLEF